MAAGTGMYPLLLQFGCLCGEPHLFLPTVEVNSSRESLVGWGTGEHFQLVSGRLCGGGSRVRMVRGLPGQGSNLGQSLEISPPRACSGHAQGVECRSGRQTTRPIPQAGRAQMGFGAAKYNITTRPPPVPYHLGGLPQPPPLVYSRQWGLGVTLHAGSSCPSQRGQRDVNKCPEGNKAW